MLLLAFFARITFVICGLADNVILHRVTLITLENVYSAFNMGTFSRPDLKYRYVFNGGYVSNKNVSGPTIFRVLSVVSAD